MKYESEYLGLMVALTLKSRKRVQKLGRARQL